MTLYWGGKLGVARRRRPAHPSNPADPAYDWATYDSIVEQLAASGIQVVFSIYGTPAWANDDKGQNVAPIDPSRASRVRLRGGAPLQRHLRRGRHASCRPSRTGSPGTSRTTPSS